MKRHPIICGITTLTLLSLTCYECKHEEKSIDPPQIETTLRMPQDQQKIDLHTVTDLEFSWNVRAATEGSSARYKLLIIKADGNFNTPLFEIASRNGGLGTSISLSAQQLDEIALQAGAQAPASQAQIKWSVSLTTGGKETLAGNSHTLTLTRLNTYVNPVYTPDFPDPTAIRANDGYIYAYSTQSRRNGKVQYVPIIRSKDLVTWEEVGGALQKLPDWKTTPGGGVWAPNINLINGKYYLFYSFAALEDTNEGCGLAISDTPGGPFTDCGKLFDVSEIGVENCIDPFYIYDEGKHYLFFGSHQGIYGVEMDAAFFANHAGLTQKEITGSILKETLFQVVPNGIEASYIYKKNGYYYLFGSNGKTLSSVPEEITYKITVARSTHIKGPYVTKDGKDWSSGLFVAVRDAQPLFVGNEVLRGPGHNGEILTDANGDQWIIYHAVLATEPSKNPDGTGGVWRRLCIDKITWTDDGWCQIGNGTPAITLQPAPIWR